MLVGSAPAEAGADRAPEMPALDTEAVRLEEVEVLQLLCEIAAEGATELLPPALHPTNPPVVCWQALRAPDSPWGPFSLALTRIECRSGTRPRAMLVSGAIDNAEAGRALRERWGFRLQPGQVELKRRYDGTELVVALGAEPVLEVGLQDPAMLPPEVVQFVSSLHPARTPRGYRLVQVDIDFELARAERGTPLVEHFDAEAWGEPRLEPVYPISAAVGVGAVTLRPLRFLCRPGELAFTGTEPVASA